MNYNDDTELETTVISTVEDMSDELTDKWDSVIDLLGWDGTADEADRILARFEEKFNVSIVGEAATYFVDVINDQYKELASAWYETIQHLDEYDVAALITQKEREYDRAWYGW